MRPAVAWRDRVELWMNLPAFAAALLLRTLFWLCGVPFGRWWHRREELDTCSWPDGGLASFLARGDAAAEAFRAKERGATDADAERLLSMLVRHGADRLPHTHARSLTAHCGGVGALLAAWGQPKHIVRAGLYHSVYATEMYPWPVFHFTQRRFTQAETLVWLYCTVSQRCVYERVRALDAIPPDGLPVKNCHTGQRQQLPAVWAARLLVLLAADIAEQDPFFDMHLVGACLRLAAPHLAVCPPLVAYLEHAGFYALSRRQLAWAHRPARRMLGWLSRLALVDAKWMQRVLAHAHVTPWLFELRELVLRRALARLEPTEAAAAAEEVRRVAMLWGTRWSRVEQVSLLRRQVDVAHLGPKGKEGGGVGAAAASGKKQH